MSLIDDAREGIENIPENEQKKFAEILNEFINEAIERQPEAEQKLLNQLNTDLFRRIILGEIGVSENVFKLFKKYPFSDPLKFKKILEILDDRDVEIKNKTIDSSDNLIVFIRFFNKIIFRHCKFNFSLDEQFGEKWDPTSRTLKESNLFIECCFKKKVKVRCSQKDGGADILFDNDIFQNCIFKKAVIFNGPKKYHESEGGPKLQRSAFVKKHEVKKLFIGCEFQKSLTLKKLTIFKPFDSFFEGQPPKILNIKRCIFKDSFKLNGFKGFGSIQIKDSEFHEKFEFKNSKVKVFKIDNTNFKKVSDFFKSEFKGFRIRKSIFEEFAAFEGCCFGKTRKTVPAAVFKYVTFKNFSTFRGAYFHTGLDIEKANFVQPANFLGATVPLENSPRETFRLIKHSFDSVGNHIEANKFFSFEMNKKRQSVPVCEFDGAVYWLNYWVSNFGQNYWKPLALLVFLAILTAKFLPKEGVKKVCSESLSFLDEVACSIFPLKPILLPGNEFWSLIIAVLSSILIWQIIVAVKRLTRR
ncbi:MAG: hypothetical protein L3J00_08925 [Thiomicrorhabdus sp.]|nr:hypothetical protein [Thiomicrorhabdus sp.]